MRTVWRSVLVVAAGAAAGGVAHLLDRGTAGAAHVVVPLRPVWTMQHAVPAGRPIASADVRLEPWPSDRLPEGPRPAGDSPVGKVPRVNLLPGEPLLEARLQQPGEAAGPGTLPVPVGHRAVTVAVDEVVGVAGFVVPGSRVDVVATMDLDGMPTSRVILEDLVVLAVAQRTVGEAADEPRIVPSATLAVRPDEATRLILASDRGHIRLAMRASGDQGRRSVGAAVWTARRLLVGTEARPARPKAAITRLRRPHAASSVTPLPTEAPVPVHRGPQTDWTRTE